MPPFVGQPERKIVSTVANCDMLRDLPRTLISVDATPFDSMI
jgi:hypothetical protein